MLHFRKLQLLSGNLFATPYLQAPTKNIHSKSSQCPYEVCRKEFKNEDLLKHHVKSFHNDDRKYPCPICSKLFIIKAHLDEHIERHSSERPYGCIDCPKSFKTASDLSKHKKVHKMENELKCPTCDATFLTQKGKKRK